MKTQHTQVPWHVCTDPLRNHHNLNQLIRDSNGFAIAETFQPANSKATYVNPVANARLIAAAPELLNACLGMIETLAGCNAAMGSAIASTACKSFCHEISRSQSQGGSMKLQTILTIGLFVVIVTTLTHMQSQIDHYKKWAENNQETLNFVRECWDAGNETVLPTDYCLETDEAKFNLVWGNKNE